MSGNIFTVTVRKTPFLCLSVGDLRQLTHAYDIKSSCWLFLCYVGITVFFILHVKHTHARSVEDPLSEHDLCYVKKTLGEICAFSCNSACTVGHDEDLLLCDEFHLNLGSPLEPNGDTYTIQLASSVENNLALCVFLDLFIASWNPLAISYFDYRALSSMLGHYSVMYPEILPRLMPIRDATVVNKKISKYQATEYILTLPISFVERAFQIKLVQVEVVDESGVSYKVDVRSKPSRSRECYFRKRWKHFCHHHMLRSGSIIR
ncbi:hypothetical protein HN51_063019 [Arachis hypogaea]